MCLYSGLVLLRNNVTYNKDMINEIPYFPPIIVILDFFRLLNFKTILFCILYVENSVHFQIVIISTTWDLRVQLLILF